MALGLCRCDLLKDPLIGHGSESICIDTDVISPDSGSALFLIVFLMVVLVSVQINGTSEEFVPFGKRVVAENKDVISDG